jgi:hypothetical protein
MNRPDSPRGPDAARHPPPIARVVPQVRVHLGRTLVDPYAWLQEPDEPEVLAYLEAENAYARAVLKPTEPMQERLAQETCGRMPEERLQHRRCGGLLILLPLPGRTAVPRLSPQPAHPVRPSRSS